MGESITESSNPGPAQPNQTQFSIEDDLFMKDEVFLVFEFIVFGMKTLFYAAKLQRFRLLVEISRYKQ